MSAHTEFTNSKFKQIKQRLTYFPVILFLTIETLTGGRVFGTLIPADLFFCICLFCLLLLLLLLLDSLPDGL